MNKFDLQISCREGVRNMMKKICALILAVVMMMGMTLTAFAAGGDMKEESGVIGEFKTEDTPDSYDDTVVIYKEITAYNPDPCKVNAPTITYRYTIGKATVASGTTVTDNASRHKKVNNNDDVTSTVAVKAGVGIPTIAGTSVGVLAITPENQLNASEYGTANRFPLTVDFSSIDWATDGSGAGVYRYVITETTIISDKNKAGIADGNSTANDELFMDVYVDGSGNIYGYVLFTTNTSIDGSTSEDNAASTAGKVEGFVDDADGHEYTSSDESTADKYYTFNFDVSKDVQNDAYAVSTSHEFPFSVSFENTNVTVNVLPKVTHTGNATYIAPTTAARIDSFSYDGTASTVTNNLTIADDAVVSFIGIPCGTTVTINEKNDVTGVTYTSVSTGAHTDASAKSIITGVLSNNATISCTNHITRATENHDGDSKVLFTNTLLQISPTGVVLRVAPYILMLVAGIVLVVLTMKRRKATVEE